MESLIVVAVLLVAYNNLANLWPPFRSTWVYLCANLALTAAIIVMGSGWFGLSYNQLGMSGASWFLAAGGIGLAMVIVVPLALISIVRPGVVDDRRLSGARVRDIAVRALIRVPAGTALLEEVAFRGLLYGGLSDHGFMTAALLSSAFFGFWHIIPSLDLLGANHRSASAAMKLGAVTMGVIVTFAAGLTLSWLRDQTQSIWLGVFVHATVNSSSTVIAFLAHQRRLPSDRRSGV